MTSSHRIVGLQVENFMRVSAASIHPNGDPVIQITGKNAEGKTSIINAIWAALCWRAAAGSIPEPIRRGQEQAHVMIDLGDLIITRTWKGEKTSLTVTTREGAKYPSPQSVLDKLVSEIGFDPLEFVRMQPRDQRTTLMNLLKIDFSEFEEERADRLKHKATAENEITGLYQRLREIPAVPEDTPDEEISASDILKQIQEGQQEITEYQKLEFQLKGINADIENTTEKIKTLEDEISRLQVHLRNTILVCESFKHKVETFQPPDLALLQNQLATIEETNRQVRQAQEAERIRGKLQAVEAQLSGIVEAIKDIDLDKRDALAAAKFPVEGLSFDETGILLNGVPFAQASTAEQIRVSLAMGIALNPDLRVLLIRDGNALDSESLRMVGQMAKDADMQIWMERVDESGKVGVIIEDGAIKATNGQQVLS